VREAMRVTYVARAADDGRVSATARDDDGVLMLMLTLMLIVSSHVVSGVSRGDKPSLCPRESFR